MLEFLHWFTDHGNSKIAAVVIFFIVFVGIIFYVFTNKDRKARYDAYRSIPLMDEEDLSTLNQARSDQSNIRDDHK